MSHVVVLKWEESEQGWGVRPDGYTVHLTDEDREAFVRAYWDEMPASAPPEYWRPSGTPYLCDAEPSTITRLEELKAKGIFGFRVHTNTYPGTGGSDGWMKQKPYDGGKA